MDKYDKLTVSDGKYHSSVVINITFYTDVHSALTAAGYELLESDIEYVPSMESAPTEEHDIKKLKKMRVVYATLFYFS